MSNRVTAVDARRSLGRLLNIVSLRHEEITIERAGKAVARLCPCKEDLGGAGLPESPREMLGTGKRDFRKCRGLGRKLWQSVDPDEYVRKERSEWDRH